MSNECGFNVDGVPPFRYQSTPQDPPTAFQIETSQKNLEDWLGRFRTAVQEALDDICTEITDIKSRLDALETP